MILKQINICLVFLVRESEGQEANKGTWSGVSGKCPEKLVSGVSKIGGLGTGRGNCWKYGLGLASSNETGTRSEGVVSSSRGT